jgi:hypothetical protein
MLLAHRLALLEPAISSLLIRLVRLWTVLVFLLSGLGG